MEENNSNLQTDSDNTKSGSNNLTIVLLAIVVFLLLGISFLGYKVWKIDSQNIQLKEAIKAAEDQSAKLIIEKQSVIDEQNKQEAEKQSVIDEQNKQEAEKQSVIDEQNKQEAEIARLFKIITPQKGETICLNKPSYKISWQAPQNFKSVKIKVSSSITAVEIGTFEAVQKIENNIGYGSIDWNLKNDIKFIKDEYNNYTITLQSYYNGKTFESSIEGILIQNCK